MLELKVLLTQVLLLVPSMAFSTNCTIAMFVVKDVEPPGITMATLITSRLIDACVYLFPIVHD
jgi:hypothetical protein